MGGIRIVQVLFCLRELLAHPQPGAAEDVCDVPPPPSGFRSAAAAGIWQVWSCAGGVLPAVVCLASLLQLGLAGAAAAANACDAPLLQLGSAGGNAQVLFFPATVS